MSVSETTGQGYYSGEWEDVKSILSVLNIDEGKLATLDSEQVEKYQEMVDREIDGVLGEAYHTPFTAMNKMMPDGTTKAVLAGDLVSAARYWTAALLLLNEFQQLAQNVTDQAATYLEDSKRRVFAMKRLTHHIQGQRRKSHYSRTMPPNFQPPSIPEQDF